MPKNYLLVIAIFIFSLSTSHGQSASPKHSGDVLQMLEKLNTVGSVLYIAAHPDDENTQLISYFANGMHLRTAYLSATRGDGGQNLIGTEIRESLGIIRTQELLAARGVDGGQQFFSRANDFGYSKDPTETFNKWDKEKVLADFVWVIRTFKPDVIVTRFNLQAGTTHGHHTASAMLAKEAFALSGDPHAFPEQLNFVEPWQVKKLFWNTSTWFYGRNGQQFDPSKFVKVDVGQFNPYLGESYTEISARSRSMHKSQGFGRGGSRGAEYEYLEQWEGEKTEDIFGGIDMTWTRLSGTDSIQYYLKEALLNFDAKKPSGIIDLLVEARRHISKLQNEFWKEIKLKEIDQAIVAASGTYLEFTANRSEYSPGDSISISFEAVNRSDAKITLSGVSFSRWSDSYIYGMKLGNNQVTKMNYNLAFSPRIPISNPYWLENKSEEGMYVVDQQQKIGMPENEPVIIAKVLLKVGGAFIEIERPVIYKRVDRVDGEIYTPLAITPKIMVNLDSKAMVYASDEAKNVEVRLIAGADLLAGTVQLDVPKDWKVIPENSPFKLEKKGEEQVFSFKLFPPKTASDVIIGASAKLEGQQYSLGREQIVYDHIPTQTRYPKAQARAIRVDVQTKGLKIGYLMGAGDEVPSCLEQIGYKVELLDKDDILATNLKKYDAVILGIRAFNTLDWLKFKNKELFEYAKAGGTVIVQYNTTGTVTNDLAPYPFKLTHDRVAVEEAEVRFLKPNHPVLNVPNKIGKSDFDGWVQERGLYFAADWDSHFETVISANDPGEPARDGSLLIALYGQGYYMYTGISFFRELPAGVPGAYRLLANMISLGKK
jgi:LmbE family N-acetylglucosaminyl deacetylase